MKKCAQSGCDAEIQDAYTYCYEHYKSGKTDMKSRSQWHEDPVVDALLKLNANMARIAQALEGKSPVRKEMKEDAFLDDLQDDPRD